jgi:signal transduction histidine kinase
MSVPRQIKDPEAIRVSGPAAVRDGVIQAAKESQRVNTNESGAIKKQWAVFIGSIFAMVAVASGGVTAQWWIVLGVPLSSLDSIIYLLPNFMAIIVGIVLARILVADKALRQRVRSQKEREQVLEAQRSELERMNRELELFACALAHDLRGPLAVIHGFSEEMMLANPDCDELSSECLYRIQRAARRMDAIINGLMRLSSVRRKQFKPDSVNVSELAREIVDVLKESDPDAAIEVTVQPAMRIHADRAMLEIALTNLLSNAWKFSRNTVAPAIRVEQSPDGVISVRDNGVGFDQRQADGLFEPFQRCHAKDDFEGSGIGLSTVKRVAERHGGTVWAEGRPGAGAAFFLRIGAMRA